MISPSFLLSGGIINYWNCPSVIAIVDCFFHAFHAIVPARSPLSLSRSLSAAVSLLFCNLIWQQVRRDPVFNRTKHRRQSISRQTFPLIFPWQKKYRKKRKNEETKGKFWHCFFFFPFLRSSINYLPVYCVPASVCFRCVFGQGGGWVGGRQGGGIEEKSVL